MPVVPSCVFVGVGCLLAGVETFEQGGGGVLDRRDVLSCMAVVVGCRDGACRVITDQADIACTKLCEAP